MEWRLIVSALVAGIALLASAAQGQIQSQPLPPPAGATQSPPAGQGDTTVPPARTVPPRTPTPLPVPKTGPAARPRTACPDQKVDINSAPAERLRTLPHIGGQHSSAIIKARPYAKPDDLVRKKVLKKAVYDKIKTCITASPVAVSPAPAAMPRAAAQSPATPVPLPTPGAGGSEPVKP